MAVCWRSLSSSPFLILHSHNNNNNKFSSIRKPLVSVSETVLFRFPTGISLSKSSFPFPISIPITPNLRFPSLPTITRSSTSESDSESESASAADARPSLLIKGLPKSTTEGRLMKAFSEFGKVNQVKILIDKMSGQSLGLAYVWFVRQEFAQLAARQMNGKVYICDNIREIIQKTKKKEAIQQERPLRIVSQ